MLTALWKYLYQVPIWEIEAFPDFQNGSPLSTTDLDHKYRNNNFQTIDTKHIYSYSSWWTESLEIFKEFSTWGAYWGVGTMSCLKENCSFFLEKGERYPSISQKLHWPFKKRLRALILEEITTYSFYTTNVNPPLFFFVVTCTTHPELWPWAGSPSESGPSNACLIAHSMRSHFSHCFLMLEGQLSKLPSKIAPTSSNHVCFLLSAEVWTYDLLRRSSKLSCYHKFGNDNSWN